MTEAEWNECADPQPMLEFLRGKASERKLRLFAVACCRSLWFVESWYLRLGEVTERFADGQATVDELLAARNAAHDPDWTAGLAFDEAASASDIAEAVLDAASNAADAAADALTDYPTYPENDPSWAEAHAGQISRQHGLLLDIFGNPFRPVTLDPACLAWNNGTVVNLAQAIYDERAFDRLPILADALEDAGCHQQDILTHCRGGGEHVRGCWVVDLMLGKE